MTDYFTSINLSLCIINYPWWINWYQYIFQYFADNELGQITTKHQNEDLDFEDVPDEPSLQDFEVVGMESVNVYKAYPTRGVYIIWICTDKLPSITLILIFMFLVLCQLILSVICLKISMVYYQSVIVMKLHQGYHRALKILKCNLVKNMFLKCLIFKIFLAEAL